MALSNNHHLLSGEITAKGSVITKDLLKFLKGRFALEWNGMHGVKHWSRVRRNGMAIARESGANSAVVELFAFLHDCCRTHDGTDNGHGWRAARLVEKLQGKVFLLSAPMLRQLIDACEGHTHEQTHCDLTIATCWDADRLDLGRVGIRPDPERLSTEAAKRMAIELKIQDCSLPQMVGKEKYDIPEFLRKCRD
jgi:uncharacterized protein